MFEVKNYGTKILIEDKEFFVNSSDPIWIDSVLKVMEKVKEYSEKIQENDPKGDPEKSLELIKETAEYIAKSINYMLSDNEACEKILGVHYNSFQNRMDLFVYVSEEIKKLQEEKFNKAIKDAEPEKDV